MVGEIIRKTSMKLFRVTTGLGYNSARTLYNQNPFFKDFLSMEAYKDNMLKLQYISLYLIMYDSLGTFYGSIIFLNVQKNAGNQN